MVRRRRVAALTLFLFAAGITVYAIGQAVGNWIALGDRDAESLRPGRAEEAGMNAEVLRKIDGIMSRAVADGVFPGGVVFVARKGVIVKEEAYGYAALYKDRRKTPLDRPIRARKDTVYDVASLTKLFTATAVMQLVERGKVGLDDPVARYLPRFAAGGKEKVTVRHLLTHTGGLPEWIALREAGASREERIRAALTVKPVARPGTKYIYSDVGFIALGELVEAVSGEPLDRYVKRHILDPLDMKSTVFNPPSAWRDRIAATEGQPGLQRGMVWGAVHDENAWALGGVAGHAGLFSTAGDLARFAQAILNGGQLDGAVILKPETVKEMVHLQTEHLPGVYRGLGWHLNQVSFMGRFASPETYGHTGFTGTSLVIDPEREVIIILLTNRVHPTRQGPPIAPVRAALADVVYGGLE